MPKDKKRKPKESKKFLEKFWVKATGLVITISALIGIGVSVGIFKGEIDCKIERLEVIETYQAKIQEHKQKCNAIKVGDLDNGINDMNEIIELINKTKK
tara:strand:+ start:26 stop:322 length:297 start_codon:yes stop_codon:yes gene_type:complete